MSKIKVEDRQTHENHELMENFVEKLREDFVRFYTYGNKSAGIRLRKNLMTLKKYSQKIRVDILDRIKDENKAP